MKRFITNLILTIAVLAANVANVRGEIMTPQDGDRITYRSSKTYKWPYQTWQFSDNMIQDVDFEDGKLYIEKLCGSTGWAAGEINEEELCAVFQSPVQLGDNDFIYSVYGEGEDEVELKEFIFEFTEDRNEIRLRNTDDHEVILKRVKNDNPTMWWKDISMVRWNETPATPPEDGTLSYLLTNYVDAYQTSKSVVAEMITLGDEVWITKFIESGCLKGEIQNNGNIHFTMPQYMGLSGNFPQYTYAMDNGTQVTEFDLVIQEDGSYVMEEGVTLWAGGLSPEYCVVYSASFTPVETYTEAPLPPSKLEWDSEYDNCFDFELSCEGLNGENIPTDWMYWQVMINGEPYVFTVEDFPSLRFILGGDADIIPASLTSTIMLPNYDFLYWGRIGEGKYRCYLPHYSSSDKVAVRAGCKVGENAMQWSDAVELIAEELKPNTLPASALYFTYANVETLWGPTVDDGLAMHADYDEESMRISGFFGRDIFVEGNFDELRRKAVFNSNQVIGESEDNLPITIVAASATPVDPSDPNAGTMFTAIANFTLNVSTGGERVSLDSNDVYLLEVIGGNNINTVWSPGLKLVIVTDEVNEIPETVSIEYATMSYTDIREDGNVETDVILASEGDDIWMECVLNSNWYRQEDIDEYICLKGKREKDSFVFDLPQFMGLAHDGKYISYATADIWSFAPSKLIFEREGESNIYRSNNELWLGTGISYPLWRLACDMVLTMSKTSVNTVNDEVGIDFANGEFISSNGCEIEVFNLSGIKVVNRELASGTYIVVADGKTVKMSVR